jgi:hypothetical protein
MSESTARPTKRPRKGSAFVDTEADVSGTDTEDDSDNSDLDSDASDLIADHDAPSNSEEETDHMAIRAEVEENENRIPDPLGDGLDDIVSMRWYHEPLPDTCMYRRFLLYISHPKK